MTKPAIQVYLGHPQSDPTEQQVLNRLRRDLERREISACILANVLVGQRQLDFVILTERRLVQCELKGYRRPVVSKPNGDWYQVLPDGSRGSLLGNPFGQASEATYALSDELRSFARASGLEHLANRRFYRDIDTVVCLFPNIPDGSHVSRRFRYVSVVGYDGLLERLSASGPRPRLDEEQWKAFFARLGVAPLAEDPQAERLQHAAKTSVQEYRAALMSGLQQDLPPRVPTGVLSGDARIDEPDLPGLLRSGATVALTGPSGVGKSHLARHAAVACSRDEQLVIWLDASAYAGNLDTALDEATAPYSSLPARELMDMAARAGAPVVVVADGLNECPRDLGDRLLKQLGAMGRQREFAVVITAQSSPAVPENLTGPKLRLAPPGPDEKAAILRSYSAPQLQDHRDLFATPFELAIAAECLEDAQGLRGRSQLLDAYVRRLAPHETVRAALRQLAWRQHLEMRSSLTVSEASIVLQRDEEVSAETVETALSTRLVGTRHGRVSFRHELLARFLAAEELLIRSPGDQGLVDRLAEPRHRALRPDMVALLADSRRLGVALATVEDPDLLVDALTGALGGLAKRVVTRQLEALLEIATASTTADHTKLENGTGFFGGQWRVDPHWTGAQRAGLVAIGRALSLGHFLEPVVRLLGQTDALARAEMLRLSQEGDRTAISSVVGATYAFASRSDSHGLASTHIVQACHNERFRRPSQPRADGLAAALLGATGSRTWGVLYISALLTDPSDPEDLAVLPDLLVAAWHAGGYHLRLEVLQVAQRCAWKLEGEPRARTVKVLQGLEAQDLGTSTTLIEALAAFDLVSASNTVEDIHEEVRIAVEQPDRNLAQRMARGIVASQWEEERIVGPYVEALEELAPEQRRELLLLAIASADTDDLSADWIVNQLAGLDDDDVRRAVTRFARAGNPSDWHAAQWGVRGHLAALKACVDFSDEPPLRGGDGHPTGAWATVSELIFWLQRSDGSDFSTRRVEALWGRLLGPERSAAGDVFYQLASADMMAPDNESRVHDRLVTAHPAQLRELVAWSLAHRAELSSPFRFVDQGRRDRYFVELLGRVGDSATTHLLHDLADDAALTDGVAAAARAIDERCVS